jgi:hypothetical protein
MYETSGLIRPALGSFLAGGEMSDEHITIMRAYFRQWIMATAWDENPHGGVEKRTWLQNMRNRIDSLTTREALQDWVSDATNAGMDPL